MSAAMGVRLAAVLLCAGTTCVRVERGEPVREPAPSLEAAADQLVAEPAAERVEPACTLYVAGYHGVQCTSALGQPWRTIFATPVDDALFDGDEIVAWSSQTAKVVRISAATGATLAEVSLRPELPPGCDASEVWPDTRIIVALPRADPTVAQLCFELANGPYEESEDLRFAGVLALADLSFTLSVVWSPRSCPFGHLPKGRQCELPELDPSLVGGSSQYRYALDDGRLLARTDEGRMKRVWGPLPRIYPEGRMLGGLDVLEAGFGSFVPIGATRSGRFVVLEGNTTKGDVAHVELLLFDREQGLIHPLPDEPTSEWPAPLELDELRALEPGLVDTLMIIRGDRPRNGPDGDMFAIGPMLFDPLHEAVSLPGELVVAQ